MKPFDQFLAECLPGIKKVTADAMSNLSGDNPVEKAAYASAQITLSLLREYHEWLSQQLA